MPSAKSYWKCFGPVPMEVKHNSFVYSSWMDDDVIFHQPTSFNTLTHVTTLENAEIILQEGFKVHVVGDYSCVNKLSDKFGAEHPLIRTPFIWMAPDNHESTAAIRYGNVAFSLNSLISLKNLRFYHIEYLDNVTKTVARIMLTTKNYDHLFTRLDPMNVNRSGKTPVMYDGNEWFRYTSFSNSRNDHILLDIEFLLDVVPEQHQLLCRYVKCYDPRPAVSIYGKVRGSFKVYNGSLDALRLIALLARYQGCTAYELYTNAFIMDLITQIQSVRTQDDFLFDSTDFLDNPRTKKVDYIMAQINFSKAFDLKEYQPGDWYHIQMLDFVYHNTGVIPNIQTILNVLSKAINGMKEERTIKEVFTLFLQCFLSSSAKKKAKKSLINILCSL